MNVCTICGIEYDKGEICVSCMMKAYMIRTKKNVGSFIEKLMFWKPQRYSFSIPCIRCGHRVDIDVTAKENAEGGITCKHCWCKIGFWECSRDDEDDE